MGNLAVVSKYHYSADGTGDTLRKLINLHKDKTLVKAKQIDKQRQKAIHRRGPYIPHQPSRRLENYQNDFLLFQGGNDAILEYIPNGNNKNSKILCASSAVNYISSPFANIRIKYTGRYVLVPSKHKRRFNSIITNREREFGKGHRRVIDTEYKLLEKLASTIQTNEVGHINLFTYYEPCLSCDYVIIQFQKCYPRISMSIYFEEEYRPEKGAI